jgi:hypothetical protein
MGRRKALCLNKKGEPIRILHVGHHFCIRNIKQQRALQKKGYKVDALTNRISYGTDSYDRVFFYHHEHQFDNMISEIKDWYDIIQVANEPDWMLVHAHKLGAKNLIHDCHDLDAVRIGAPNLDEVRVFNKADGVVFVSKPIQEFAVDLHDYKKPSVVLEHYCNENHVMYSEEEDAQRTGIVYEGGANPPWVQDGPFKYRTLHHLAQKIVEMGNELHMYIGNMDGFEAYHDTGAIIYPPTNYDEMMIGMVKRKWGACVFNNEGLTEPQTNLTTMNKAYEYVTAGLPVIFLGAPYQAKIFKPYNISIELEKMEDLGNVEEKYGHLYPELKANVEKARKVLTMERHIHVVENLYNKVLGNK